MQQLAEHPTAWQPQACGYHQARGAKNENQCQQEGGEDVGEHLEEEVNRGERQLSVETASLPLLPFTSLTPLEGKTHFFFFIWHFCPCLEEMPPKWL